MDNVKWFLLAEIIKRLIQILALGILVNAVLATALPSSVGLIALIDSVGISGFISGSLFTGWITELTWTLGKATVAFTKQLHREVRWLMS
jgi:hypothetical protein